MAISLAEGTSGEERNMELNSDYLITPAGDPLLAILVEANEVLPHTLFNGIHTVDTHRCKLLGQVADSVGVELVLVGLRKLVKGLETQEIGFRVGSCRGRTGQGGKYIFLFSREFSCGYESNFQHMIFYRPRSGIVCRQYGGAYGRRI